MMATCVPRVFLALGAACAAAGARPGGVHGLHGLGRPLGVSPSRPIATVPPRGAWTCADSAGTRASAVRCAASGAPPSAEDDDGEKDTKGDPNNPLILRLIRLAAETSANALARALRPVEGLLRGARRDVRYRRLVIALLVAACLRVAWIAESVYQSSASVPTEMDYSRFLDLVKGGAGIQNLQMGLKRFDFVVDGQAHFARPVYAAPQLISLLTAKGIPFRAAAANRLADSFLPVLVPIVWLVGLALFYSRQNKQMSSNVGKRASAQALGEGLSFDDVQGIAQAKSEVAEVVAMLRNPARCARPHPLPGASSAQCPHMPRARGVPRRYIEAGARLPSGILLAGPPGTGKTLLARVLASEAGVPFFYCSGSDFVEIFVGRGASRLRSLFVKAAKVAPCVIFIDELDALGATRRCPSSAAWAATHPVPPALPLPALSPSLPPCLPAWLMARALRRQAEVAEAHGHERRGGADPQPAALLHGRT